MKKLAWLTFVLVALYLLFRNAEPYKRATEAATDTFSRAWSALTGALK